MWTTIKEVKHEFNKNTGEDVLNIFFDYNGESRYTTLTHKALMYWKGRLHDLHWTPQENMKINIFEVPNTPLFKIVEVKL